MTLISDCEDGSVLDSPLSSPVLKDIPFPCDGATTTAASKTQAPMTAYLTVRVCFTPRSHLYAGLSAPQPPPSPTSPAPTFAELEENLLDVQAAWREPSPSWAPASASALARRDREWKAYTGALHPDSFLDLQLLLYAGEGQKSQRPPSPPVPTIDPALLLLHPPSVPHALPTPSWSPSQSSMVSRWLARTDSIIPGLEAALVVKEESKTSTPSSANASTGTHSTAAASDTASSSTTVPSSSPPPPPPASTQPLTIRLRRPNTELAAGVKRPHDQVDTDDDEDDEDMDADADTDEDADHASVASDGGEDEDQTQTHTGANTLSPVPVPALNNQPLSSSSSSLVAPIPLPVRRSDRVASTSVPWPTPAPSSIGDDDDIAAAAVKPFSCPMCNWRFSRAHELKRHMDCTHFGKKFTCLVCGKNNARKDARRRHQITEQACVAKQASLTDEQLQEMECVTRAEREDSPLYQRYLAAVAKSTARARAAGVKGGPRKKKARRY
ncbi:hypothetical protein EXIGLDRAFT_839620 [Exidia glandulosa HHB12029]|uniref:C2H2-type domain-containing protein n=1 Tax=Exidia glandulosa HHB12029 TaxID=1314781 RepID=A0A166A2B1_EXIGL|nr:hypothetical protein EXIGLDRAFT_839620 [Exidia glandulosa HHB12029]